MPLTTSKFVLWKMRKGVSYPHKSRLWMWCHQGQCPRDSWPLGPPRTRPGHWSIEVFKALDLVGTFQLYHVVQINTGWMHMQVDVCQFGEIFQHWFGTDINQELQSANRRSCPHPTLSNIYFILILKPTNTVTIFWVMNVLYIMKLPFTLCLILF